MLTISIITVAYNSEKTIRDTLSSVSRQTYPHIEHIVVDGGSTDNTLAIVREFPHIKKVISERDKGVYDGMNKGLRLATGNVIGCLNSDDMYADNYAVERIAQAFEQKNIDSLYSDLEFFEDEPNNVVRVWNAGLIKRRRFLYGWMPPHPTFFVKRSVYQKHGNFNLDLVSAADYELMLRFIHKHQIKLAYLPEFIIKMRVGGKSNVSLKNRIRANNEDRKAWKINGLKPHFYTLYLNPLRKIIQLFKK